jgi:hypothetical protein
VSTDNDGVFADDQLSENGAAQKSVVAAAIPITLNLFMTASPSYSSSRNFDDRKRSHGASLM